MTPPPTSSSTPIVIEDHFGLSKIGKVRKSNQDAILMDPTRHIYCLADGMGGQQAGEVASAMSVNYIVNILSSGANSNPLEEIITQAFVGASHLIKTEADQHAELRGMGTTTVCTVFEKGILFMGHVGDSRIYLLSAKNGLLYQLTKDHSLIAEAELEEDHAKPLKNILTRCVGYTDNLAVDTLSYEPHPGDKVLLCSDGLHGFVSHKTIEKTLIETDTSCKNIAHHLIEAAYDTGAEDNVSVIILKFNQLQ